MAYSHWFLSVCIMQDTQKNISIDQSRYVKNITVKYLGQTGTIDSSKYKSPISHDFLACTDDQSDTEKEVSDLQSDFRLDYPSAVGVLIYLTNTCPDIDFSVPKLARFMKFPGRKHYQAILHLLHYLALRTQIGIQFYHNFNDSPIANLLTQSSIKNTRPVITFSNSS